MREVVGLRCRGVHLIERNEEVCIFYERVNLQGNAVELTQSDLTV